MPTLEMKVTINIFALSKTNSQPFEVIRSSYLSFTYLPRAELGSERVQLETDRCLARDFRASDRARARGTSTRACVVPSPRENSSRPSREQAEGGRLTERVGFGISNTRPISSR